MKTLRERLIEAIENLKEDDTLHLNNMAKAMVNLFNKTCHYDYETEQYNEDELQNFRKLLKQKGNIEIESPESSDSSWIVTFEDGSKLYMGNPHQEAFTAFVYEKK